MAIRLCEPAGRGNLVPIGRAISRARSPRRYAPRDDGRRYAPRDDGRRYAPRDDGRRYAPRDDGRRYAPRDDGRRYAPRDDVHRYAPRDDVLRFAPRDDGGGATLSLRARRAWQSLADWQSHYPCEIATSLRSSRRRRRQLPALAQVFAACLILSPGLTAAADTGINSVPADWAQVRRDASGQTVYFNAWGGDPGINRYLAWAAEELRAQHDVRLVHVKVTDIAEAVSRIMAEKKAGRDDDGSVDLLWINGENFAALKRANLLWGPWAERIPHAVLVDWQDNPTTRIDMTFPTEGYELPWGTAAFTLFYHQPQVPVPPRDPAALLAWIEQHPGRFSYPQPPAFLGSAFLKQLLLLLTDQRERLLAPAGDDFADVTEPLWQWLDRAHAAMWRGGRLFPPSGPAQRELLAVGELDWMMSYNPSEASRAIRQHELHETIGALHFSGGALANTHFLAIPANASARAGAMVAANFLLSPQAQARKADERYWGDPTVLDRARLTADERALFDSATSGAATPPPSDKFLPEPHPSWTTRLEAAWLRRYAR